MKHLIEQLQEELKKLNEQEEALWEVHFKGHVPYEQVRPKIKELQAKQEAKANEIVTAKMKAVQVGDGITIRIYTDCEAYTVIARTEKTLTLQRDKATLKDSWKPEFVPGGFAMHCCNQEDQEYDYEADPNGKIIKVYWSNKYGRWLPPKGHANLMLGRHEYYDYNF